MNANVLQLNSVGASLRRARIKYGVGLRKLAESIKISPSVLSRVENGKEKPSNRVLSEYAKRFRLNLDELSRSMGKIPHDMMHHLVTDPDAAKRVREEMRDPLPEKNFVSGS